MKLCKSIVLLILPVIIANNVLAFDDVETHPAITARAVEASNLKTYIAENLGYADGIDLVINGEKTSKWLIKGSTDEDHPLCRASNHMHNPLLPWNMSGMSDEPGWLTLFCSSWTRYSAVTWATGYTSPAPNGSKVTFTQTPATAPNNWDNARYFYNEALTGLSDSEREYNFARSLQALGQNPRGQA